MVTEPKDVLKQLASSDAGTQCDAVRCLKNEIIGNPNRKQCFIALGAVPKIVRILAHPPEPRLAVQAAATLGSFAYQNTDGVAAIVDCGGVAHLLKSLSNSDRKLVEASLRSLKMIFQSPVSPRDVIFLHPAFDRLVEFLDMTEKSFVEDTLIIFAKCCQSRIHQDLLLKSGALPKMIRYLFSPSTNIQVAAMEALDKLSASHEEVCASLLKRDDIVKTLLRFLRGRIVRDRYAACCLLANLSASLFPTNSSGTWFSGEVTEVLLKLLDEPSVMSRVPATLSVIAWGRMDLQQQILEANGFRKLWTYLTADTHQDNKTLQVGAIRALGTMCQYITACRREFVTSRIVWRVLGCMDTDSVELRLAALRCFEALVLDASEGSSSNRAFPATPFSSVPAVRLRQFACVGLAVLVREMPDPDDYIQDTIQFLLPYALSAEPGVRHKALWALGDLIRSSVRDPTKTWIPILNDLLWSFVRAMVQDTVTEVQEDGLALLEGMVRNDTGIHAAINWSNGELLPLIAQKLDTPKLTHVNVVTLALDIAAAVSNSELEHQTAVMGSGVPPCLLGCLEEHCAESIKQSAINCIINLTYRDVLPWGGEDYRSADCRAKALLELGIEESLSKLEKLGGSELLMKLVKDAISFLGQLD